MRPDLPGKQAFTSKAGRSTMRGHQSMNARWKIWVGLAVVAVACVFIGTHWTNSAQTALEQTRRELRQQGFKIDLADFNFSTSPEIRARAAALTTAGLFGLRDGSIKLMTGVSSNSAVVLWRDSTTEPDNDKYFGSRFSENTLNDNPAALDAACVAALTGPIRFDLNASAASRMLLPHLAPLKSLVQTLGARAVLDLRDGNKDAAWTNLLASTALVTSWDPEPSEVSHLVRCACATIAYDAAWQALQSDDWSDARLANLQRAWESADFFKGFPETTAFTRAAEAAGCQQERRQSPALGLPLTEMIRRPKTAWQGFTYYWRRLGYLHRGSYEDERSLLLFYRERELQLRAAVQCPTWSQMRQLPAATNFAAFQTKNPNSSPMLAGMRLNQLAAAFQGRAEGPLARAAETEARRRILIAAIAIERYRGRHGSYPKSLQELAPELLKSPPIDFMDGQPLRYRLTGDGHFLLYSVGLDCTDDGGKMPQPRRRSLGSPYIVPTRMDEGTDLVWPLPASPAEVAAHEDGSRP
jgi:hypothetical protein